MGIDRLREIDGDIEIRVGLCEGRHEIPFAEDGYVFPIDEDRHPLDFATHTQEAARWFNNVVWDVMGLEDDGDYDRCYLYLYVTGLTPLLVAFLQEYVRYTQMVRDTWDTKEKDSGWVLLLHHYNSVTGEYEIQLWDTEKVITW